MNHQNVSWKNSYRGFFNHIIFELSKVHENIRILDLCERFDPYMISSFARKERIDYKKVFENIMISRAFTVYQFSESIRKIVYKENRYDILILSSVKTLFADEDVSENIRFSIFDQAIDEMMNKKIDFYIVERYGNIYYGGDHGKDTFDFNADNRENKIRLGTIQKSSQKRRPVLF